MSRSHYSLLLPQKYSRNFKEFNFASVEQDVVLTLGLTFGDCSPSVFPTTLLRLTSWEDFEDGESEWKRLTETGLLIVALLVGFLEAFRSLEFLF